MRGKIRLPVAGQDQKDQRKQADVEVKGKDAQDTVVQEAAEQAWTLWQNVVPQACGDVTGQYIEDDDGEDTGVEVDQTQIDMGEQDKICEQESNVTDHWSPFSLGRGLRMAAAQAD